MKIEIGESLVYSWLRHVKHCQIVQMNWRPSPEWKGKEIDFDPLKKMIENEFNYGNLDIFKKNNDMNQFLKQAEIDVIGFEHHDNKSALHFVDVAFHEGGLNYGSKDETISRVLKKYIRSYFIYQTYFNGFSKAEFYFLSPKVSVNALYPPLEKAMDKLNKFFRENGHTPKFHLIVNEQFSKEVLEPILSLSEKVKDSNELFMRSAQLWKLFEKIKLEEYSTYPQKLVLASKNGKKIGQHVRDSLKHLVDNDILGDDEVNNLLDSEYSKSTFNLNFPFLRLQEKGKKDKLGYNRYYAKIWTINGEKYYFCSQWYDEKKHWDMFDKWLEKIKVKN